MLILLQISSLLFMLSWSSIFRCIYGQPGQILHFPDSLAAMCGHRIRSLAYRMWEQVIYTTSGALKGKRYLLTSNGSKPHWAEQTGACPGTVEQWYIWRLVPWYCKAVLIDEEEISVSLMCKYLGSLLEQLKVHPDYSWFGTRTWFIKELYDEYPHFTGMISYGDIGKILNIGPVCKCETQASVIPESL